MITPVVAPVGTDVVMLVAVLAETVAVVPLNFTVLFAGVALKLVPVIITEVPTAPLVGLKLVMVGAGINVNPARVAVPPGVVTLTLPEVPDPTTAVMLVAKTTLNDVTAVPPKLTAVAPVKLVPVMVMVVPLPALVGLKLVMVGIAGMVVTEIVFELSEASTAL